ncbi:hypothetical protein CR513_17889, partial [Mucuna pruriens]
MASRIALVTLKTSKSSETQTQALISNLASFSILGSLYICWARVVLPIPPIPTIENVDGNFLDTLLPDPDSSPTTITSFKPRSPLRLERNS